MKIRFLKDFENNGKTYKEGLVREVNNEGAEWLVENGYAEEFKAMPGDEINMIIEDGSQVKAIDDVVKEILKAQTKDAKLLEREKYEVDSMAKTGGFLNMAEFAQHVHKVGKTGMSDKLSKYLNFTKAAGAGLVEGVDSDGGFLVPTEFRNQLMKDSLEASIVRPRATVIPMQTNSVKIPVVSESSRSSSVYGGVIIYRPGEVGSKTESKPKFGQIQLNLSKLVGLAYVSDELLEDSPISVAPLLTTMFSEAIAFQEDEDCINGTGANQALGILNAPCLVNVSAENGQAPGTIVIENIDKMWSRLKPRSHNNAVWLANNDVFPELASLTRSVGTGGSAAGIATSVVNIPTMTMFGRPLILTEHCQTLGDAGDLILADWRQYLIGEKASGLQIASSIHLKFDYDQTAFRFVKRFDGQPWELSARTPKHSSNTLSSFVALAART